MNAMVPGKPIALAFLLVTVAYAQASENLEVENPVLREELLKMAQLDQEVRQWVSGSLEGQPDSATVARMNSVDSAHTERLKKIIELYGWPDYSLVGQDGAGAAFLIVQHSPDTSFQERILPVLREAYERGEVEGQQLALLTDRVLVNSANAQLYGTQAQVVHGTLEFYEIEDPERVDERRAELGLPPQAVYKKVLEEAYGIKHHGMLDEEKK